MKSFEVRKTTWDGNWNRGGWSSGHVTTVASCPTEAAASAALRLMNVDTGYERAAYSLSFHRSVEELSPEPRRACNHHRDCDAADAAVSAAGIGITPFHCRIEDCEGCFAR